MDTTPTDVIKILQVTVNFMEISLLGENLAPSTEMERQENVDRLKTLIEKLNKIKDKGFEKHPTLKKEKKEKKEKKSEKPPRPESTASYTDMNDGPSGETSKGKKIINDVIKEDSSQDTSSIHSADTTPDEVQYILPGACVSSEEKSDCGLKYEDLQKKVRSLESNSLQELKEKATFYGSLLKHKKRLLTKWHKRYCILIDEFLFYFRSEDDSREQGVIILPGYTYTVPPKSKGYLFNLECKDKSRDGYVFQADHQEDFDKWNYYLQKITNMKLTVEDIGVVNKLVDEHDEKENTIDTESMQGDAVGEIYDDVVSIPTTKRAADPCPIVEQDDIYDDVVSAPASIPPRTIDPCPIIQQDDEYEIYDDVAVSPTTTVPQISQQPPLPPQRQPELIEEETYELIPRQPQATTPVPSQLSVTSPTRSLETTDAPLLSPTLIIPPRPSTPHLPLGPIELPSRNKDSPSASPLISPGNDTFTIENIFVGLHNCHGDDKNDLSFNRGDILYKLDEIDMNWWLAYLNGKVGVVPANFLVEAFD